MTLAPEALKAEELLCGAHVSLLPYRRGLYGRDALYKLWQLVEYDGTSAQIFYAQACGDERQRGDLVEFVTYFSEPSRELLVIRRQQDGTAFGLVWFDPIVGQGSALMSLWYQRHTTKLAREGTALAMRYAFEALGYTSLRGFTPWRTAVQHVLPLGWQKVATLPGFVTIHNQPQDVYVMQWQQGRQSEISWMPLPSGQTACPHGSSGGN